MKKRRFALLPNHLDTQAIGILKCFNAYDNPGLKSGTPDNWDLIGSVAN
jgi:hypothetical protein